MSEQPKQPKPGIVVIIGSGLGGLSAAIALQSRGFTVKIYERDASPDERKQGYGLTLQVTKVLGELGVLEEVLAEFGDQADHVIVLLCFFVHVDGKVRLIGTQIHALCVFKETFSLEFPCFLDIEHSVFRFR
jgi:threonine dehydrogenase-like Zn-dependent dehydrogenase